MKNKAQAHFASENNFYIYDPVENTHFAAPGYLAEHTPKQMGNTYNNTAESRAKAL